MVTREREFLEADKATLENILANLDETQYITKLSFQQRLKAVEEKLSHLADSVSDTITVTFKGAPVDGSHGIFADFAAKAIGKFSEAFAAFAAMAEGISLARKGFIPASDKNRLLITHTAHGSFGFELQLPKADPDMLQPSLLPMDYDYIQTAKNKLEAVINEAINGDDEQLADSIADVDQRALDYVQAFFETMVQERATFVINSGSRKIVCSNREELRMAASRLKPSNIVSQNVEFEGQFVGILPEHRDFEFKKIEGITIRGKIDKAIAEPDSIIANWYKKPVKVIFGSKKIGNGYPRFTLESLNKIEPQSE